MDWRRRCPLSDCGQALAETPVVVAVMVAVALLVIQVALFMLASTVVSQTAGEAARVAATIQGDDAAVLEPFVASRLEVLGSIPALMVPGSLRVSRTGTPRSALVSVTVEIKQQPLPIVGWVVARGTATRTVRATAQAPGGESWALPDVPMGEVVYGAEQKP